MDYSSYLVTTKECSNCGGEGYISYALYADRNSEILAYLLHYGEHKIKCHICQGKGTVRVRK